jgi:hypothetical protein
MFRERLKAAPREWDAESGRGERELDAGASGRRAALVPRRRRLRDSAACNGCSASRDMVPIALAAIPASGDLADEVAASDLATVVQRSYAHRTGAPGARK